MNKAYVDNSEQIKPLNTLKPGNSAVIKKIRHSPVELRDRLLRMGFVEGAGIRITHIAPLGCPITVRILGSQVCLRCNEAKYILVQET